MFTEEKKKSYSKGRKFPYVLKGFDYRSQSDFNTDITIYHFSQLTSQSKVPQL